MFKYREACAYGKTSGVRRRSIKWGRREKVKYENARILKRDGDETNARMKVVSPVVETRVAQGHTLSEQRCGDRVRNGELDRRARGTGTRGLRWWVSSGWRHPWA